MKKSKYTEAQIAAALRQVENGTAVVEICRKLGIAEATFYLWRKKYGSMGTPEIRETRQLREENARLKKLVADLSLDRQILQEVVKKSGSPITPEAYSALGCPAMEIKHAAHMSNSSA